MTPDTIPITPEESATLRDWATPPPTISAKDAWAMLQETGRLYMCSRHGTSKEPCGCGVPA